MITKPFILTDFRRKNAVKKSGSKGRQTKKRKVDELSSQNGEDGGDGSEE